MTPEQITIERVKFEAYMRTHIPELSLERRSNGHYRDDDTGWAFEGYLACAEEKQREIDEAFETGRQTGYEKGIENCGDFL